MCLTTSKYNLKEKDRRKYIESCKKEQKDKNINEI